MASSFDTHDKYDWQNAVMKLDIKPHHAQRRKEKPGPQSSAAGFLPTGPCDPAFLALRLTVFRVHSKSASPLSKIIYEELGMNAEGASGIFAVIDRLCPCPPMEGQAWLAQSEDIKLRWPPYAKLYAKIEEARKILSIRLRDTGLEDIEVAYSGPEATVGNFKMDYERIGSLGGKIYHYYPLDREKRTMRMSVIINTDMLEEVYEPRRLCGGHIAIGVNTPQAPDVVPPTPAFKGSIFPFMSPLEPRGNLKDSIKTDPEEHVEHLGGAIPRISDDRVRSDGILKSVRDGDQQARSVDRTAMQPVPPQSDRIPNDADVQQYLLSGNHAFWMKDLAIRSALIRDYNRATGVEILDKDNRLTFTRRYTNKHPSEAVPKVDYPLVPELCSTYTADRNLRWYRNNVGKAQAREDREARIEAEQGYQKHRAISKKHESLLEIHVAQSRTGPNRHDARYHAQVKNMMGRQIRLDNQLKNDKGLITQLREAAGVFPTGVVKGLEGECEPPALENPEVPTGSRSQTGVPKNSSSRLQPAKEGAVKQKVAFAEPENTKGKSRQVVPSHQHPAEEDVVSFPKYEEPILDDAGAGEEQSAKSIKTKRRIEILREEAKTRKATATNITNILAETGITPQEPLSTSPASVETVIEARDPSPVTPNDLLGLSNRMEGGHDEAEVSVAQSDLLSGRGGAIEQSGAKGRSLFTMLPVIVEERGDIEDNA